jgi:hypothetical protein
MRNDARPIGEAFQDIAEHDRQENAVPPPESRPAAEQDRVRNKPFVTNRDSGDEEFPSDASDR